MYIPKSQFGWSRNAGWLHGDEAAYDTCMAMNKKHAARPGRSRTHNIHPSWADYVAHFDPTNPERSQGAFCRWAGMRPSSLSAAKRKQIHIAMEEAISIWIEELQKLESE